MDRFSIRKVRCFCVIGNEVLHRINIRSQIIHVPIIKITGITGLKYRLLAEFFGVVDGELLFIVILVDAHIVIC